jgi:hypothetical protein
MTKTQRQQVEYTKKLLIIKFIGYWLKKYNRAYTQGVAIAIK